MNNTEDVKSLVRPGDISSSAGSRARSTFEEIKHTVADKLHAAAETIEEKAAQNQESAMSGYAGSAARWLDDASDYIRQVEPQRVKSDVQAQIRRNPGRSLLIAGAVGLMLGVLFRRR